MCTRTSSHTSRTRIALWSDVACWASCAYDGRPLIARWARCSCDGRPLIARGASCAYDGRPLIARWARCSCDRRPLIAHWTRRALDTLLALNRDAGGTYHRRARWPLSSCGPCGSCGANA